MSCQRLTIALFGCFSTSQQIEFLDIEQTEKIQPCWNNIVNWLGNLRKNKFCHLVEEVLSFSSKSI